MIKKTSCRRREDFFRHLHFRKREYFFFFWLHVNSKIIFTNNKKGHKLIFCYLKRRFQHWRKCLGSYVRIGLSFDEAKLIFFYLQKQPFADVLQYKCSKIFCNIHMRTLALETLFNKAAGPNIYNFIKKQLRRRCFPVNITKFLRTPFL